MALGRRGLPSELERPWPGIDDDGRHALRRAMASMSGLLMTAKASPTPLDNPHTIQARLAISVSHSIIPANKREPELPAVMGDFRRGPRVRMEALLTGLFGHRPLDNRSHAGPRGGT